MKLRSGFASLMAAVACVSFGSALQAADLHWDANGNGDPINADGSGTWDLTSANWYDSALGTNTVWSNGSNATFGTSSAAASITPNNIDLSAAITVNDISLSVGADGAAYNISDFGGGSLTLQGNILKLTQGLSPTPGQGVFQFYLNNGLTLTSGNHTIGMVDSPNDAPPEMTFTGEIKGSGGLTINNAASGSTEAWGTAVFQSANSYTGATSITFGRMVINDSMGLGATSAGTTISDAGTLSIGGSGTAPASSLTISEPITIQRSVYSGGEYGRYGAAVVSNNGAGTTTFDGAFVVDSNDARIAANTSRLEITQNITAGPNATTPMLSIGGDFAGFVHLSGNNTALTGGVNIVGAQLDVDNDNQIGGPNAPLQLNGGVYHPVNGYATNFGTHDINELTFNGSINVDDGKVFSTDQALGQPLGTASTPGSISKRGTGTLNINQPVNLRGGFCWFDGGVVNITADMEIQSLHLRSPVVNITASVTGYNGWTSVGSDSTGTNGGPDIATINISGNGKLIQANDADFNVSDNANTQGTINISGNGLLETTGINFIAKNPNTTGVINQTGGTLNVKRSGNFAFVLADARGGDVNVNGTYNLSGGTFTTNGEVYAGEGGAGAIGTWNQSGGTATISNWFVVGRESGSGDVTVSGGSLIKKGGGNTPIGEGTNARGNTFTVKGTGLFDAQTGEVWVSNGNTVTTMTVKESGTVNVNNYYVVGRFGNSKGFLVLADNGVINKAGSNPIIVAAGGGSQGTVTQTGGTINNTTTETWISDGGTAVWNMSGGTLNLGTFDVGHAGAGSGVLNVSGAATINATTLRIGNAGSVAGTLTMNGGTLKAGTLNAGASTGTKTFTFNGGTLSAGTFNVGSGLTNTGTGKVSPGLAAAGSTAITGNYTQGANAFLAIDLGGSTAGSFDAVTATGAVVLDGKLQLTRLAGYNPANLTAHTIISGASVAGVFSTIDGVSISSSKALAVTYTANSVVVTAARPGDTDLNGNVNFDDLLVLAQNYNGAGVLTWSKGDFDGTGTVVFDDLLALAQNYGLSGVAMPTVDQVSTSISAEFGSQWAMALSLAPEPTSLALLGLSGVVFSRKRR